MRRLSFRLFTVLCAEDKNRNVSETNLRAAQIDKIGVYILCKKNVG